jgi:alkanesulfonate monooxygenase SsuD/methylene tetrahydromethanopterin reductase-like flavin-dependent oxidoreductase (luciferase family)
MAFGTGVANIWAREPQTMHAAAAMLAQGYPRRLTLGLGVGFPARAAGTRREFGSPRATMRDYLRSSVTATPMRSQPRWANTSLPGLTT